MFKSTFAFLLVTTLLFSGQLHAQRHQCATPNHKSEWLKAFQKNGIKTVSRDGQDWMVVPVVIHITRNDNGSGSTITRDVDEMFYQMNLDFEQNKLQFYYSQDYNYIDNSEWHNHLSFWQGIDMMQQNNIDDVVNIYVCQEAAEACGYYAPGGNAVAINNDCMDANGHTLAHEIGHFFQLPHPFFGWEGTTYDINDPTPTTVGGTEVERIDGSNCEFAADGFCDTPPDYLSDRWSCDQNGQSFQDQIDPDGAMFKSQGDLIMSYSVGSCRDYFSDEQCVTMRADLEFNRTSLISSRPYKPLIPQTTLQVISPERGDSIYYQSIDLVWENIPNVDDYTVIVARDYNLLNRVFETTTTDTTVNIGTLENDVLYYWKVVPYAAHSPSVKETKRSNFRTKDYSSTTTVEVAEPAEVFMSGSELVIDLKNGQAQLSQVQIFGMSGQQIVNQHLVNGDQNVRFNLKDVPSQVVFVQLIGDKYNRTVKVFIP